MRSECVVPYKLIEVIIKVTRGGINDKAFSYNICGERFNAKWLLETHIEQHTQQKQYPCSKCGKAFVLKWQLKRHMLMHTEDKKIRVITAKGAPLKKLDANSVMLRFA